MIKRMSYILRQKDLVATDHLVPLVVTKISTFNYYT